MVAIIKAALYISFFAIIQLLIMGIYLAINIVLKINEADLENLMLTDIQNLAWQILEDMLDQTPTLMIISGVVMIILLWAFFKLRHKRFRTEIYLKSIHASNITPLILVGVATNFIATLVATLIPYPESWVTNYEQTIDFAVDSNTLMTILMVVVYAGIVEEVIFRGLVYTRLKRGMPMAIAMILSSVAFGAVHGSPIQIIYATLIGLVLVWVFEKFKSIVPSIIVHMVNNAVGLIVAWAAPLLEGNMLAVMIYIISMSAVTIMAGIWLLKKKESYRNIFVV
ncbi:CPBP family intramembrane glutamic endopeptidase [Candidatus Epulonipiscium viviparus]|uniref:CPBP family intramembrane glutamic endopeptidase n=1 Tax=Candidatus Epulonipiscium viviparus TaxID=420336 RepID=UPI0027380B19|nr:CPBP family intramembrane glutamic endopeptidase [Candidatus Epulopiscium viviparus]